MAELKRNFSGAQGAKMNKDLDERIIPPGQYRDALNIEISTSESSNAGTAQNIKGNTKRSAMASGNDTYYDIPDTATVVGSVAALNTDKVYYFVSAGGSNTGGATPSISKDYIMEYDPILNVHKYVFVDIYKVKTTNEALTTITDNFLHIPVTAQDVEGFYGPEVNATGVRVGMRLGVDTIYDSSHGVEVTDIQKIATTVGTVTTWTWKVSFNKTLTSVIPEGEDIVFYANSPRVLNFNAGSLITGINILDDFIYWTDNNSEPKKINIPRSIAGTGGFSYLNLNNLFSVYGALGYDHSWASAISATNATVFTGNTNYFHTRLTKGEGTDLRVATKSGLVSDVLTSNRKAVWVEEKHVTVIKKGPTQPLELQLHSTGVPRINTESGEANASSGLIENLDLFPSHLGGSSYNPGDILNSVIFTTAMDFRVGDKLRLTLGDSNTASDNYSLRIEILADADGVGPDPSPNLYQTTFRALILSIKNDINTTQTTFQAALEKADSLFEFKLPRFSYRYKYQDGEYSTFAPWSQVAFLADVYNFSSAKGYNLGMVNQLRSLEIKGYYAGEDRMPEDVAEIDILYKETNNPTVYTVKTITPKDAGSDGWPAPGVLDGPHEHRGSTTVTTDMIHEVVQSNQLLRPWDNVPRSALAQDVSANRLIYGNYLHGYDVPIQPLVNVGLEPRSISVEPDTVSPSVKSLRDYTVGVVFGDKYGRETPVVFNSSSNNGIKIPKINSNSKNRLSVSLGANTAIPEWAEYFSYYIKEPSTEYYNLVMDRFYKAENDFLWLSFPSSERNKVDEETFISLKKRHGDDVPAAGVSKYKIVSIENEAPDHVKTERVSEGTVYNGAGLYLGSGDLGLPTQNSTFFSLNAGQCHLIFGEGGVNPTPVKSVRFAANGLKSNFYNIRKATGGSDLGTPWTFHLDGRLGADVAFLTNYTGEAGDLIEDIAIQFFTNVTVNKPEFDGRFFVKVEKDADLESYLFELQQTDEVTIADTARFRYVNNNGYTYWSEDNVGDSMPQHPRSVTYAQVNADGFADENRHLHPTEWSYHHTNAAEETVPYYWGGGAVDDIANLAYSIRNNPIEAVNDSDNAKSFWNNLKNEKDFFIDGATAYSWTAYNPSAGSGSGNAFENILYPPYVWQDWVTSVTVQELTGYDFDSGQSIYETVTYPWNNSLYVGPVLDESVGSVENQGDNFLIYSPSFGGEVAHMAANMKWGNGIPSRAIRETTVESGGNEIEASYMDFSWVGPHHIENANQLQGQPEGPDTVPHRIDKGVDGDNEPWNFARVFVTEGTKFRFQQDPDKTIYTVLGYQSDEGYWNPNYFKVPGTHIGTGAWGIRNYRPQVGAGSYITPFMQNAGSCLRQRWSIVTVPRIGSGPSGYNPIKGTLPPGADGNDGPDYNDDAYRRALHHDGSDFVVVEILEAYNTDGTNFTPNGAIFETVPKESADIDIYYQASGLIPLQLDDKTNEEYLPLGTTFKTRSDRHYDGTVIDETTHTITEWTDAETIKFDPAIPNNFMNPETGEVGTTQVADPPSTIGSNITFTKRGGYSLTAKMMDNISTEVINEVAQYYVNDQLQDDAINTIRLHGAQQANDVTVSDAYKLYSQTHYLDWNNCWTFGNGVESDRIRDDYNAPQMDNGVKASSVLETKVKEERRKHGLIWSGIYNSTSGINNTNQFIAAEKITKDINPIYGSIQKLYNRGTQLLMFCEDKILRADTNRDLLFNADGSSQVVSSTAVIGSAIAYQGDYGISTNPESFVATPYQMYFTDATRGQVLRATTEGIVSISDKGMKDYFADICSSGINQMVGTHDERKKEYNLSILKTNDTDQWSGWNPDSTTVSYSEYSKGWTSFKSFIPQDGLSINNKYFTFYNGHIWEHYTNDLHNNFYGDPYSSSITTILNDNPGSVKSFGTINYEGSQAKVTQFAQVPFPILTGDITEGVDGVGSTNTTDGEYFNLAAASGWQVDSIITDQQTCGNIEFKDKEGKWFGYPSGEATTLDNLDEREFTVQGLGTGGMTHSDPDAVGGVTVTLDK